MLPGLVITSYSIHYTKLYEACLARLGRHVTSIDIEPEFTAQAAAKLAAQGISNVTLETADAARGVERGKSFDVIAVTGSLPFLQQQFHDNLNTGGRLFVISGQLSYNFV